MNNREIKFRAWAIELKEMLDPFTIQEICNGGWYDHPRWQLMQYTGLKDKNGKEIYEGDIVQYHKPRARGGISRAPYGPVKVKYVSELARFLPNELSNNELCEVIGNIYEQPELLTN